MDLINLFINPDPTDKSGVSAIALVDNPAIEEGWIAFNSHRKLVKHTIHLGSQKGNFATVSGDQQVIAGALMIPNKKIPRKDPDGKEYEVVFTPETIKQIQEKFVSLNANTSLNEMHQANQPVNGVLLQHFIIDRKQGISPPFGQDHLEDGSWYGYIKVKDKKKWDEYIKTGVYTGFSVEGYFYEEPAANLSSDELALLSELLEN